MAIAASDHLRRQDDVGGRLVDAAVAPSAHPSQDGDECEGLARAPSGARVSAATSPGER